MKPKTIYILMIICGMSLFAAAKQAGSKCDKQKSSKLSQQKACEKLVPKGADKAGYDHSPLSICLFSI
jgi:hypothetical protein